MNTEHSKECGQFNRHYQISGAAPGKTKQTQIGVCRAT
jgi:hypothetical protein